jgi:hypothetical protein
MTFMTWETDKTLSAGVMAPETSALVETALITFVRARTLSTRAWALTADQGLPCLGVMGVKVVVGSKVVEVAVTAGDIAVLEQGRDVVRCCTYCRSSQFIVCTIKKTVTL